MDAKDQRRLARYERLRDQIAELIAKTDNPVAHRATAAALMHHKLKGASWSGFYMLKDGELVVDAYQGPVACLVLEAHVGVCWAGIDTGETQIIEDVHAFDGHIACDAKSRSEVVVPILGADGKAIGVLDIDSYEPARFDSIDAAGYELIARCLEEAAQRMPTRT